MLAGVLMLAAAAAIAGAVFICRGSGRLSEEWNSARHGVHDITLYVSNDCVSCCELANYIAKIYPLALIRIVYTGNNSSEKAAVKYLSEINSNISIDEQSFN